MWWPLAIVAAVALLLAFAFAIWRRRRGAAEVGLGTAATLPGIEATEPHFVLDASGAVFVPTAPGKWLAVLLPVEDEAALDALPADGFRATLGGGKVTALVAFNQGDDGALGTSALARVAGLGAQDVYALDASRPVDRRGGRAGGEARALPERLEVGELVLTRRGPLADAVQLDWRTGVAMRRVVIGQRVPFDALLHPPIHYFMGSLAKESLGGDPSRWQTLVLWREVVLLEHLPGPSSLWAGELLSMTGVRVVTFGRPPDPEQDLLVGVLTDDVQATARALAQVDVATVVSAAEALVTDGRIDAARRLCDQALAGRHGEAPEVLFQRGVVALAAGQREEAAERYRRVTERAPQYAPAWSNLASMAAQDGDLEAALSHATRALTLAPEDKVAVRTAVLVHHLREEVGEARRILTVHGRALRTTERLSLEAQLANSARDLELVEGRPGDWEALQGRALEHMESGEHGEAVAVLERAREMAPQEVSLVAELGACLSHLARDEEAVALYSEALARLPAGQLLLLNRGNARRRLGRLDEALEDYHLLVDLAPEWAEAVAALVATLHQVGEVDAAREALEALDALECDEAVREALRALVDPEPAGAAAPAACAEGEGEAEAEAG